MPARAACSDGVSGTGSEQPPDRTDGGPGGSGGTMYNESGGRLTITGSMFSGDSAGHGGNAGAGSNATASGTGGNAGFPSGGGFGGGIFDSRILTITDSTLNGNRAGRR